MTTTQQRAGLGALVALALLLRLYGLQYGLPAVYNPDEVAIMARALSFAKGTLNPHNFLYPTFYFYVLFVWVGAYLAWVWITGGVASLDALQQLYFTDPTGIYTAGRLLGAVLGTLCVPAVFVLGRRLFGPRVGIAAAAFLAVAPLAVRDSHYVKHDIPATLAIVGAYIAIARIWPRDSTSVPSVMAVSVAGAACGVAFSTHYYCVFLALPLVWAVVMSCRRSGWRLVLQRVAIAGLASAVLFFALSPFLLVEWRTALRDIAANRQIVVDRAAQGEAFRPVSRYFEMLWSDSAGRAVVGLGAAGAGWMLIASPARAVLLLSFPIAFFVFIVNTVPASRYLNPVLPFVALLAAWTLAQLATRFRAPSAAFWIVVAACTIPPLTHSLRTGQFFRMDDTRTLAQRFVQAQVPPGSTVLVQPYSVVLTPTRESLGEALTANLGSADAASTKFQIQLALDPYPQPAYRVIWLGRGGLDAEKIYVDPAEVRTEDGLRRLRELRIDYVILKRAQPGDTELMPLTDQLSRNGRRIAEFSPFRQGHAETGNASPFLHNTDTPIAPALERPGPSLEIWKLR